jgi:hypothetical protein
MYFKHWYEDRTLKPAEIILSSEEMMMGMHQGTL